MKKCTLICCCFLGLSAVATERITLLAKDAELAGPEIRVSGEAIVHWCNGAVAQWTFELPKETRKNLYITFSSPGREAGDLFDILIDGVSVKEGLSVGDTFGWMNYKSLLVADELNLSAGKHTLKIVPRQIKGEYLMNLTEVELSDREQVDFSFIPDGTKMDRPEQNAAWVKTMCLAVKMKMHKYDAGKFAELMWQKFPLQSDWFMQDNSHNDGFGKAIGFDARGDYAHFLKSGRGTELESKLVETVSGKVVAKKASREHLLNAYLKLCEERRVKRLQPLFKHTDEIVYAVHHNMGGVTYSTTSNQGCPKEHSQLRIINLSPLKTGGRLRNTQLFDAKGGVVRDPEVSFDGKRMIFAWRKTRDEVKTIGILAPANTNYKIYEMDLATRAIRALTDESTYGSDFEPCYLPNGDIMFSSDRCVHEATCGWGDCSNLYIMNSNGRFARRVGYDQTQTAFPHLLDDGRVVYTRRDYSDRGQIYAHPLFVMNSDGTHQTEYYGNNSFFPTSLQHARQIPGTTQTMGIAGGYHTSQGGKLVKINPMKGTQDYDGLEFFQNYDPTLYDSIEENNGRPIHEVFNAENYLRAGAQAVTPYPLSDNDFLCSYNPLGGHIFSAKDGISLFTKEEGIHRYALYFMNWKTGARELLAADPELSCWGAVPVVKRTPPAIRSSQVDYRKDTGVCYVQNVYYGPSAQGIEPGTIKKLRIAKLSYKPITIGAGWMPLNKEIGPGKLGGYGGHSVTPAGVGSASWDVKEILGEVEVHEDGSAMFEVPAREPIYFLLLNERGEAVQQMRSWATLMPNENFSCVGCHEENDSTPLGTGVALAMKAAPQKIQKNYPFDGKPFSYPEFVQPIWNKHCVSCHAPGMKAEKIDLTDTVISDNPDALDNNATQRTFYQSYLTLLQVKWRSGPRGRREQLGEGWSNDWVNYFTRLATVELTPPYFAGSTKSGILKLIREGHGNTNISPEEYATIAAWIDLNVPFFGEYDEMNIWSDDSKKRYAAKVEMRKRMEALEQENIQQFIKAGQP